MNEEELRYIPFYKTDLTDEDINSLNTIIKDEDVNSLRLINNYENTFAQLTKFPFVIAVNSSMYALLLSLKALGIGFGDEVIAPSLSSPEIGEAIEHTGASLVFADIEPKSLIINSDSITKLINNKTKAVIVSDPLGSNSNITSIIQVANLNDISLIHYTYYNPFFNYGNPTNPHPHITVFINNDPMLKGAVIATYMEQTHKHLKSIREHGFKNLNNIGLSNNYNNWYYEITSPGFDCMMSGIQCALSMIYLKKTKKYIDQRIHISQIYNSILEPLTNAFVLPVYEPSAFHAPWQMYVIRLRKDAITLSRDEFITELKRKGVEVTVPFVPLHIHPYYSKKYKYLYDNLINTYEVYISAISLPIYSQLTDDDVNYIGQIIKNTIEKFSR